ncbi:hypothetical protein JR316_0001386 [Psilocybe cubensis]|uniref:Uncharacterized protein n=2 Tax=Psilocybe cubensis TaxID=181762 RepID=A0ACB8HHC0_PSICU|nr:hypothetical protein JR316_0001386 [Psilocybe cubensis]KAH9487313.1 hypothetical protein JR316_0001386 [Psilocybe cubensis]
MQTATIVQASSTMTGHFILPGNSASEADGASRVVRFDNECVLIPEALQKRPSLMVTKSYSLPLWKRKGQQTESDGEDASGGSLAQNQSAEESRVVIKVPIPLFRRRSSRSPSRSRSTSLSPIITKRPPPCLVHRAPSSSPTLMPLSPVRRPSLPIYHRPQDATTVPLRPCCEACEHVMEESLREGENWQEKFSRGAKRRRSASLDNTDINSLFKLPTHTKSASYSKEFSVLSSCLDDVAESSRHGAKPAFSLTVDEVDKRRKSIDASRENLQPFYGSVAPPPPGAGFASLSPGSPYSGPRYPRGLGRERDSSSSLSSNSAVDELSPGDILDPRHRLRSSPIEEEDEAQLFPLPSPRRSPSGTPSPRLSPSPSPRISSSGLPGPAGITVSASSSKESVASKMGSSQESLLKASFTRKPSGSPGTSATSLPRSPSPLGLAATSRAEDEVDVKPMKGLSLRGLQIPSASTTSERAASGVALPKGPRPSPNAAAQRVAAKEQEQSTPISTPESSAAVSQEPQRLKPLVPLRLQTAPIPSGSSPIPIPGAKTQEHEPSASSHHSFFHLHSHSQSLSSPPTAPSRSSTSPVRGHAQGQQKRKLSFSAPFIRAGEALRDASVDVLKGVSSMSGTAI